MSEILIFVNINPNVDGVLDFIQSYLCPWQNVKITSSGTQLVEIDREHVVGAKHTMTEQIVRQKSVLAKDNDVSKIFNVFKRPWLGFVKTRKSLT